MICKRCGRSGWLLRPKDKTHLPVRKWFKKCTDWAGTGLRPALKYLRIFERQQLLQPPEHS